MAKIPQESERLIYMGPNLPGGVLHRSTVYKGGLPTQAKELIEKCPALEQLFVPVGEMAAVENDIGRAGTPAHAFYGEVVEFIKTGGAKA